MANTIYTYHDITQATINQIGVSQARTNATTGDNIFVLNNTKVTSINFISSSAATNYLQVPTGTQINDVLIAYSATGTISSPPQTLGGWKNLSVSAGSVGIFFKIVSTAAETTEMLTSSVNLPNDIISSVNNTISVSDFIKNDVVLSNSTSINIEFDSVMVSDDDLVKGTHRLLEVDNRVVLPVNTHIRVLVTGADVIHNWAVPSLGLKIDCVPGKLNQVSLFINREGTFYGQCSELCGVNHGFMPIVVEAVSLSDYVSWISNKLEA